MDLKAHRHTCSASAAAGSAPGRRWMLATRVVGIYFAGSAVLNAVYTVRTAHRLMAWFHDSAWVAPYRPVLKVLERIAPTVVLGTAAFEAVVGYHLLRGHRVAGALRWAQAWVIGLIPALPWPYWAPNAVSAGMFEIIRRRTLTGAPHRR